MKTISVFQIYKAFMSTPVRTDVGISSSAFFIQDKYTCEFELYFFEFQ
jgi:hypothetical protein